MEILENIGEGLWVFEEGEKRQVLNSEEVKEKLKELVSLVREWKSQIRQLPASTPLFFVHEPSEPKAFKIYDLSSLGCAPSLNPPRWKVYRKELEGQLSP